MKVTTNTNSVKFTFAQVSDGECFLYNNTIMLKLHSSRKHVNSGWNAVDLINATLHAVSSNEEVTPKNMECIERK